MSSYTQDAEYQIGNSVITYNLPKQLAQDITNALYYDQINLNISDKDLEVCSTYNISMSSRGKSLDVSSEFNGDFSKIKSIHFLKGTHFDRDFFRRMYPQIKIKYKPSEADVIVYDEKSLFNNDNPPILFKISSKNEDGKRHIWSQESSRAFKYIYEFLSTSPGRAKGSFKGKIRVDDNNSKILSKICSDEYHSTFEYIYLNQRNEYFEEINASNKQYLHSSKIIANLESSQRSNQLSYNELITLFEQITSKNVDVVKTAAETLIMFNSAQYLPIQKMLLSFNAEHVLKSKKVNMFCTSYSIRLSAYDSIPRNFFEFFKYAENNILSMIKGNSKYDSSLLLKFLKSPNLMEYIIKPHTVMDSFPLKNISINFEFKNESFNEKPPTNNSVDQTISEFIL